MEHLSGTPMEQDGTTGTVKEGDYMKPKEWLDQIRRTDRRIQNKLEEITSLKEMLTSITATLSVEPVSHSGNDDKMGSAVAKIVDLENEIHVDLERFIDLKREVFETINGLEPEEFDVLYLRYFKYMKWEEIADDMHYTCRHITRIHGEALENLKSCPFMSVNVDECP